MRLLDIRRGGGAGVQMTTIFCPGIMVQSSNGLKFLYLLYLNPGFQRTHTKVLKRVTLNHG